MKKLLFIHILIFFAFTAYSQISQFAGPNRNQVYDETGLLDEWPEEGPELFATISGIGAGYASPAINEQGIFIPGMIDTIGYMFHYNHDHELVWKYKYGQEFTRKYLGSRGTATVEGNRLYYSGTYGDAFCLDAATGEVIWKKNLMEEYGGPHIRWGYTESPLIYKDLIILTPGGPDHSLMAFDKYSGDPVWTSDLDSVFNGYCSPILIEYKEEELVLMNTSHFLLLFEPNTGEVRYRQYIYNPRNYNAPTPLYREGKVFYSTGYGVGSALYDINDETGTLDTIYYNDDLDTKVSGMIIYDGTIFGAADRKKQWVGIDFETGKTMFMSRDLKPGSFLLADDKFFIFTDMGEVALAKPRKDGFDIISRFKIPVQPASFAFSHPVLYEGKLYVRYLENLWIYKVK